MTGETFARFICAECASCRIIERDGTRELVAHCPIQPAKLFVEADARFIKRTVVSKDVGLTCFALTKRIENRLGDGGGAIGDSVETLVSAPDDLIRVWFAAIGQARV